MRELDGNGKKYNATYKKTKITWKQAENTPELPGYFWAV